MKTIEIVFDQKGDFEAINAARQWCTDHNVSVGSMQRDDPMGLLYGDYDIQKWRNLSKQEIKELDGTITGDKRNGPVKIQIKDLAK
jgi:hypothetical protein